MVHSLTGPEGLKGQLSLESADVVFRPEAKGTGDWVFKRSEIRRVRRVMGSPILELRLDRPQGPPVVGFYFVRPPSLEAPKDAHLVRRRAVRRTALIELRRANLLKKNEVAGWARAIREAAV
jgi:hypothetical protein